MTHPFRWKGAGRSMVLAAGLAACTLPAEPSAGVSASSRFLSTATALRVPGLFQPLCVAIDTEDPQGIRWWGPWKMDCTTRSTGPGLFPAFSASVSKREDGVIEARFRIHLKAPVSEGYPPYVDVTLAVLSDRIVVVGGRESAAAAPSRRFPVPGWELPTGN